MVSGASWFVGGHLLLVPSHGKDEGALWDLFFITLTQFMGVLPS